jgi:hypothetical protein
MLGAFVAPSSQHHDFLNLYNGATMAREGVFAQMHDPQVQLAHQRAIDPPVQYLVPFVRLHWYAALLSPLSLLPLATAFWLWIGIQTASLIALWVWCKRQWGGDALILCSLFLPAALGIASGQDCVWIAWIVAGIYGSSRDRSSLSAGFLLGMGFLKFHLFLLWPIALLLQKRWRSILGAALAVGLQLVFSLAVAGWSGLVAYPALLMRKDIERLSPSPELMTNVQGLTANAHAGFWFQAALTLIVVALTAGACWKAPLWRWTSAAAVGSLLVAPHVYGYDASLLLVPLIACVFEEGVPKRVRVGATALLAPLVFFSTLAGEPWAAATPLVLLLFLLSLASSAFATLPIYDLRSKDLEPAS